MVPDSFPQRIVCLTEETTETLYLLGEERRIVGISGFTVRPPPRPAREAAGLRVHEREPGAHRQARARSCARLLGSPGRYRRFSDTRWN